jgi:hypothetical protein
MIASILENLGRIAFARNVLRRATRDDPIHGEADRRAETYWQATQFPVVPERIARFNAEACLINFMRHPVERSIGE